MPIDRDGLMVPDMYLHQVQAELDKARAELVVLRGELERRDEALQDVEGMVRLARPGHDICERIAAVYAARGVIGEEPNE